MVGGGRHGRGQHVDGVAGWCLLGVLVRRELWRTIGVLCSAARGLENWLNPSRYDAEWAGKGARLRAYPRRQNSRVVIGQRIRRVQRLALAGLANLSVRTIGHGGNAGYDARERL